MNKLNLYSKEKIRFDVAYIDFVFQNEFRCFIYDLDSLFLQLNHYLDCPKKENWDRDYLLIAIEYEQEDIHIERKFQEDGFSTYKYLQSDETKKWVNSIDLISKEEINEEVKKFFIRHGVE